MSAFFKVNDGKIATESDAQSSKSSSLSGSNKDDIEDDLTESKPSLHFPYQIFEPKKTTDNPPKTML